MKLNRYNTKLVALLVAFLLVCSVALNAQEPPPEPKGVPEVPPTPTIVIEVNDLSLANRQIADQYLEAIEQLENTFDDYANYFENFDSKLLRDYNITFERFAQGIETNIYSRNPAHLVQDLEEYIDLLRGNETSLRSSTSRSDKKLYRLIRSLRRELAVVLDLVEDALADQKQSKEFEDDLRKYISYQLKENQIHISVVEQEAFARQYEQALKEYAKSLELLSEELRLQELKSLEQLAILEGMKLSENKNWLVELSIEQQREVLKALKSIDFEFTPGNEPVIVHTRKNPAIHGYIDGLTRSKNAKSGDRSFTGSLGVTSEQMPIYISHPRGDLRITGCNKSVVSAELYIEVNAPTEKDRENFLEAVKLNMGQDKDGYFVETVFPRLTNSYTRVVKSVLEINIPSENRAICDHSYGEVDIERLDYGALIKGNNSEITATNISGRLKIENCLGSVTIDRVEGSAQITNSSGRILITECSIRGKISNSDGLVSLADSEGNFNIVNSGPINIVDHSGNIDIENYNGSVSLLNITGDVNAYSTLQPLIVENIDGEVTLENRNADIKAYQISKSLRANTSFANIEANWIGEQIDLKNNQGNIIVEIEQSLQIDSRITTTSGKINLIMPVESDLLISAVADEGTISSDFPMDLSEKGSVQSAKILIGRGSTKLVLKAIHGSIVIEEL